MEVRLNKYLAQKGYASRRGADVLIEEGAVTINGEIAKMGQKVNEGVDTVEVNAKAVQEKTDALRYFVLNKPEGVVCATKKTQSEPKIILDFFPSENFPRIYPIGRLDKDSCGLIILTNDGDLTFKLMHPSHEHEKEYYVEIYNELTDEMLQRLREPFFMLGQKTRSAEVTREGKYAFRIILKEGKNRQIRRMVRALGSGVSFLQRIRVENIFLPDTLKEGEWVEVSKADILWERE